MKLLWAFFRQMAGEIGYLLFCAALALMVFVLCDLPLEPVVYVLGLWAFSGVIILGCRFVGFWKRHRALQGIQGEISDTLEYLPMAAKPLEEDYQALLQNLFSAKSALEQSNNQRYEDLLDYYTLWVHQVKTPIAAMQLILQEQDTPEYLELRSELFKIQQYIEMVLCYLRLDSRSTDFVFCCCEVDDIIREAVRTYAGQLVRRKVRLNYEPVHMTALTDKKWLEFVVEQLISNALKYAPGGTVTIWAEEAQVLVIEDDGIGIAPQDLPRIFEQGFTGFNGRGNQRSTGLGLYLCKQIVGRLGHTIEISATPGQGTKVRLNLSRRSLELD